MFKAISKMNLLLMFFMFLFMFSWAIPIPAEAEPKVILTWNANVDADYYGLYYREKGTIPWITYATDIKNIEKEIVLPKTNQDYELAVKAFNIYGNSSDFSDSLFVNMGKILTVNKVDGLSIRLELNVSVGLR